MQELTCCYCGGVVDAWMTLPSVPPMQNRLYASPVEARNALSVSLEVNICSSCQHLYLKKSAIETFDCCYNNEQLGSDVASRHLEEVADILAGVCSDRSARIVEIGCGRGELLNIMESRGYRNLKGYDPVVRPGENPLVEPVFWSSDVGDGLIDLLILRHTLEEMRDPDEFLAAARSVLSPKGWVYCEFTPSNDVIAENDFFSIYPEYFNLFSIESIMRLFQRVGLRSSSMRSYFSGRWLGLFARNGNMNSRPCWDDILKDLAKALRRLPGPVVLWGAGGRGENLLSYCGLDTSVIEYVVDINPAKQGMYIPPFGQKVIAPEDLPRIGAKSVVVASGKYFSEIKSRAPEGCRCIMLESLSGQIDDQFRHDEDVNHEF